MNEPGLDEALDGEADAIDRAAADWLLAKQFSEKWSIENQAALDAWFGESDAHLLSYWRLEEVWNRSRRLKALRSPMRPLQESRPSRARGYIVGVVGLVAVATALAFAGMQSVLTPDTKTYSTPIGGHLTLTLVDGSKIELNTDSALKVSLSPTDRFATLEKGEVLFDIVHNAAHPFTVMTAGQRITDLGTKFTVRNEGEVVRVSLIEGSARLESTNDGKKSRATDLKPGDVATATATDLAVRREPIAQLKRDLGWRNGLLVFDNTTLADAAAELNRYNNTKIVVSDPQITRLSIGGTFRQNDIMALLNTAKQVFGLKVRRRGDNFEITH